MPLVGSGPIISFMVPPPSYPVAAAVATFIVAGDSYAYYFEPPTIMSASTSTISQHYLPTKPEGWNEKIFDYTIRLTLLKTNNKLMGTHWWWSKSKILLGGWGWLLIFLSLGSIQKLQQNNHAATHFAAGKSTHNNIQLHCQQTNTLKQTETVFILLSLVD